MQMSPLQSATAPVTRSRTPDQLVEKQPYTPRLGAVKHFVAGVPELESEFNGFPEQVRDLLELKDMEDSALEALELEDIERRAREKAEQLQSEILLDEKRLAEIDAALAALLGETGDVCSLGYGSK